MNILDLIPFGKENKVTTRYLMQISGKSMRAIREEVKILKVSDGVCTTKEDGGGYWRSDNRAEQERTASTLESGGFAMLRTAREIRKKLGNIEGQEQFDWED